MQIIQIKKHNGAEIKIQKITENIHAINFI